MQFFQVSLGLLIIALGWAVLFRTRLIYKINAFMREHVFSDQLVLFSGRRVALLLFILGAVALFSGLDEVMDIRIFPPNITGKMLEQAKGEFQRGKYDLVQRRCVDLVRSDPKNIEAWELLAYSWKALGQSEKAQQAVEAILRLDPNHPIKKSSWSSGKADKKSKKRKEPRP